tara:strand:+ start:71 stop:556 length:486 start_codon:yes stop_codon:yes gene_type:complete
MAIQKGKAVLIDYTLKNEEGTIIDTSNGKEPLGFIHGAGTIIVGLEQILIGKAVGDEFTTAIMPEDAYGLRHDDYVQDVSINQFEDKSQVKVGAQFQIDAPQRAVATIVAVNEETVTMDLNHPLAGETLYFDIKVVEVRLPDADELNQTKPIKQKCDGCCG